MTAAFILDAGKRGTAMNYHEARLRSDQSGWAWTTMNDGVIHTSGGCVTWPQGEPKTIEEAMGISRKPTGEPHQHPSRRDAERCFWEYERARLRETSMGEDTQHRCQYPGCTNWTQKGLSGHLLGDADLCDAHRTPDGWSAVHPFVPDIAIAASY